MTAAAFAEAIFATAAAFTAFLPLRHLRRFCHCDGGFYSIFRRCDGGVLDGGGNFGSVLGGLESFILAGFPYSIRIDR